MVDKGSFTPLTVRIWATGSKIPGTEGNRQIRPLCRLKWDAQITSCKGRTPRSPKLLVGGLTGRKPQSMFYWSSTSSLTATHLGILLKTVQTCTFITPIKIAGTGFFALLCYVYNSELVLSEDTVIRKRPDVDSHLPIHLIAGVNHKCFRLASQHNINSNALTNYGWKVTTLLWILRQTFYLS